MSRYDGQDCLVYNQLNYDPELGLATGRIVWFVRETELWWRDEETHTQRAWSDADVCAALAGAGLELIGRFDPERCGDHGWPGGRHGGSCIWPGRYNTDFQNGLIGERKRRAEGFLEEGAGGV